MVRLDPRGSFQAALALLSSPSLSIAARPRSLQLNLGTQWMRGDYSSEEVFPEHENPFRNFISDGHVLSDRFT